MMKAICIGILLSMSLLAAEEEAEVEDPNLLHQEAVRENDRGNYQKAVDLFRYVLSIEPNQPIVRSNLFTALKNYSIDLARQGQADAAIKACSEALSIVPLDVTVASNLAIFFHNEAVDYLKTSQYDKARISIMNAEKVVDQFRLMNVAPIIRRTHADLCLMEGRDLFLRNDVKNAMRKYDEAIALNPMLVDAYKDRAWIYFQQDLFEDALSDLDSANRLLGGNPNISALIQRIKLEAKAKGIMLEEQSELITIDQAGLSATQIEQFSRLITEIRVEVARYLQVNPKTPIVVQFSPSQPVVLIEEWVSRSIEQPSPDKLVIGFQGADTQSPDFRKAVKFYYINTLMRNIGDTTIPFWFTSGLAQILANDQFRLTDDETDRLLDAGEQPLLMRADQLNFSNIKQIDDSNLLRLANLQSKALVTFLFDRIRQDGLGQILRTIREGATFDQALLDVTNLTPRLIDEDWRKTMGMGSP